MTAQAQARRCWLLVVAFAVGMAWCEAATVYYLRVMVDRIVPYQANPLPMHGGLGQVELVREAATLLMLFTIGAIAGRTRHARLGYSVLAFGVWDVLYYVFLRVMSGWPASPFDWDILFLLPLPWWGPVLAPVCIALLMIAGGTLASQSGGRNPFAAVTATQWGLASLGVMLALYAFMIDALHAVGQGLDAARNVLPETFNWPLFCVALALMTTPVIVAARAALAAPLGGRRRSPEAATQSPTAC